MQTINIDLIPGNVMPVFHASQFDTGRECRVNLYNGGAVFTLSGGETVSVSVRKPDGNVVTETLTNTSDSYVEIITTEQMTACDGANICKIKIEDGATVIGTANFVLEVEEDPLDGGIASQSEINNLATQVADLVSEQYDSANVIFDAVPTAGHGNGYAVTSEGIKDALDAINNPDASAVNYDNTDSGLTATNVQDALDEVAGDLADLTGTTLPLTTNPADGTVSEAIGDLSDLTTTNKDSLVDAVNEVNGNKPTNTAGSPFLKVKTTANITKSISANSYASILGSDIDLSEAGYTPIGIVSMYNTQSAGCFFGSFDCSVVSGSSTFAIVKNTSATNITATMNFKILFMRTTN